MYGRDRPQFFPPCHFFPTASRTSLTLFRILLAFSRGVFQFFVASTMTNEGAAAALPRKSVFPGFSRPAENVSETSSSLFPHWEGEIFDTFDIRQTSCGSKGGRRIRISIRMVVDFSARQNFANGLRDMLIKENVRILLVLFKFLFVINIIRNVLNTQIYIYPIQKWGLIHFRNLYKLNNLKYLR